MWVAGAGVLVALVGGVIVALYRLAQRVAALEARRRNGNGS